MALSEDKLKLYTRRLLTSRMRLLVKHGFYGLLLMHMRFAVDEAVDTACTDGQKIIFGPAFLEKLDDRELDFVMLHEVLHVALRHCARTGDRDHYLFNCACDIVVNSNILLENGMDEKSISLRESGGALMHLAPDGKEGHEYTAEEVYEMLKKKAKGKGASSNSRGNGNQSGAAGGKQTASGGKQSSGGNTGGRGNKQNATGGANGHGDSERASFDDHSRWGSKEDDPTEDALWASRIKEAAEAISIRDPDKSRGLLPLLAERLLKEMRQAKTDWRQVLAEFVQEDITDYSFAPPDRRLDGSPFFLPDFNERVEKVENILFMIDTSGSMSDEAITECYFEVLGAIDQFADRLSGKLGFFDATITEPQPFTSREEFRISKPRGGGGTSFDPIFRYATQCNEPPTAIIILTDGYAPFPPEEETGGIPVLWIINNEDVTPPYGQIARLPEDK